MSTITYKSCVLFGGTGFIGSHLAAHFLREGVAKQVTLVDLQETTSERIQRWPKSLQEGLASGTVKTLQLDVRKPLEDPQLPQADLIVNLAAVHREPGHEEHEYYDTNLPGATNICAWSEKVGCDRVIFTSSIAVYGPSPAEKDEFTAPTPTTPYGKSKLEAEQIHRRWQEKDPNHRLLIVRPGLIFGPGEGGNLTRMVKAVLGRYFFYTGNQDTRKAGGYVKELCTAIDFMMQKQNDQNEPVVLFNFTMDPPPTVKQYAQAICQAAGIKRFIPSVPLPLLLVSSYFIDRISRLFGINQPINPIRVRKATRSNNIRPTILRQAGYKYHYSLLQALTDWRHDRPEDWH